jgi:hypothetical protein
LVVDVVVSVLLVVAASPVADLVSEELDLPSESLLPLFPFCE